jgi:hypothetical protein
MNDSKYITNVIVFQSFLTHYEEEALNRSNDFQGVYIPKVFIK